MISTTEMNRIAIAIVNGETKKTTNLTLTPEMKKYWDEIEPDLKEAMKHPNFQLELIEDF